MKIEFLDTTLRDGAQSEGISYSKLDKKIISDLLINFGIDYVECGDPSSNPKDEEFFKSYSSDKYVAFSGTHRKTVSASEDRSIQVLLDANTKYCTIFGKSGILLAKHILNISETENLKLIKDTVSYIVSKGKTVFYDAEHFFDSYKNNRDYALKTIETAHLAGADVVVLCDTNGGCLPEDIKSTVTDVKNMFPKMKVGIHTHNDIGCADISSIAAIEAGATHVQGTFLGFGERCGNANLSNIIPTLVFKLGYKLDVKMEALTSTAREIANISNINLNPHMPYVGSCAFTHKAGTHTDGILKMPHSFEHVTPSAVGNSSRILLSEISGKAAMARKLSSIIPNIKKTDTRVEKILKIIKEMELNGYQFEGADASLLLLAEKELNIFKPSFKLISYSITSNENKNVATVTIEVNGKQYTNTSDGNGPVHALDKALRSTLSGVYPQINDFKLEDYKVRVIDSNMATGALVRVVITSKDSENIWKTVGVSTDVIKASWFALSDSFEFKLQNFNK